MSKKWNKFFREIYRYIKLKKMERRICTLIVILIINCFLASAETLNKTKDDDTEKIIKDADKAIARNDPNYKEALNLYLKALEKEPNNASINFKIGFCYLSTIEKTNAIPYLEKAFRTDATISPEINFLLARSYHLNYEFDKAIDRYIKYKKNLSPKDIQSKNIASNISHLITNERIFYEKEETTIENLGKLIDKRIQECKIAKELVKIPTKATIKNAGSTVNSIYPDYGPVIKADESEMYFTSRRDNTTGGQVDPKDGHYYEDIYYVTRNADGSWGEAVKMGRPINTENHDAVLSLSADGQTLFIYDGGRGGDVYECRLKGDEWVNPVKLDERINSVYTERSASLSADEKMIFFERDAPEGYGGRDIFVSKKNKEGKWEEPVNLGVPINTEYDEDGVFFHPDGKTLYFSSTGHNSMGGYDIFKSIYENGRWSKPINLGYPINTPDDDIFFVLSADGTQGYYSSVKEDGFGDKDIYQVIMPKPKPEEEATPFSALTLVTGTITDPDTKLPTGATIQIVDNTKNEIITELTSNSKTGKYLISLPSGKNYGIVVLKDNYLFHSENFNISASEDFKRVTKDIELQKADIGNKITLNNIFFDFGKSTLRPESVSELNRLVHLLNSFPYILIEIAGHADNIGDETYNRKLSEDRAQEVVNFLISNNISKDRLFFTGYGSSQPLSDNSNAEGRQQNRRTEFRIREFQQSFNYELPQEKK